ncbi:MAG UNVERIFIED_CONTAM: hypothetical protein LVR18_27295 [Planctomycetaceae bacterium]|jgi:hypothetical protein
MTTDAVRNMIQPWLTGNDEKDAQMLRRMFRGVGLSIAQWRQVVAETKAQGLIQQKTTPRRTGWRGFWRQGF